MGILKLFHAWQGTTLSLYIGHSLNKKSGFVRICVCKCKLFWSKILISVLSALTYLNKYILLVTFHIKFLDVTNKFN